VPWLLSGNTLPVWVLALNHALSVEDTPPGVCAAAGRQLTASKKQPGAIFNTRHVKNQRAA
jgi:plasmid stability protein